MLQAESFSHASAWRPGMEGQGVVAAERRRSAKPPTHRLEMVTESTRMGTMGQSLSVLTCKRARCEHTT